MNQEYEVRGHQESENQKVEDGGGGCEHHPDHVLAQPVLPEQLLAALVEPLGLLVDASRPFLRLVEVFLPALQQTHVLPHDLVDALQLALHAVHVLEGGGVFKLALLGLDGAVELDEVVVGGDGLEAGGEVGDAEEALGLVEEGRDEGVEEAVGELGGVGLVEDAGEHHVAADLVEDVEGGMVDLLQHAPLRLRVGSHLAVVLLHPVLHSQDLLVHVPVVGLAEHQTVSLPTQNHRFNHLIIITHVVPDPYFWAGCQLQGSLEGPAMVRLIQKRISSSTCANWCYD